MLQKLLEYGFDRFHTRTSVFKIRERFGDKPLVGVEIGTRYGYNARMMLKHLHIDMLYLVDPYDKKAPGYRPGSYDKAWNRLKQYSDRVCFLRDYSFNVVDIIPGDLDFVYIDGAHDYESVKRDISLFYPKLSDEGVLCGHDFESCGVSRAVVEFMIENKLDFMTSYCLPRVDWFTGFDSARKPGRMK